MPGRIVTRTRVRSFVPVSSGSDSHQCLPHGACSIAACFVAVTNRRLLARSTAFFGVPASRRQPDALERPDLLGDRALGRQALDRAGAVEAVDAAAVRDDVLRVGRLGDRAAVADDEDVRIRRRARRRRSSWIRFTQSSSVFELFAPIDAAGRDAHVRDDDVGARLGHPLRLPTD